MRIADFISLHREAILTRWEAFARTRLPAASKMSALVLRDHGPEILDAVIEDLRTSQTREEQEDKSKGMAPVSFGARETAAQAHAVMRARSEFDINQLASEYRALRASVLQMWSDAGDPAPTHLNDMVRFNEAIDQALAESIGHFHQQVELARNLFLGVVSHDLRSPLYTVRATASYLAKLDAGETVATAASRLARSAARMEALLDDLVEFNRVNLGVGIGISPIHCDVAEAFVEEIDLLRVAHAPHRVELEVDGDCSGWWDPARLRQALANLVQNAVQHGAADGSVRVHLVGAADHVLVDVHNRGEGLSALDLEGMFEPLRRGDSSVAGVQNRSLGLGLFVVRQIAKAHGGEARVRSDADGTVFTVLIPRRAASQYGTT